VELHLPIKMQQCNVGGGVQPLFVHNVRQCWHQWS
jgi:hypothetical protein